MRLRANRAERARHSGPPPSPWLVISAGYAKARSRQARHCRVPAETTEDEEEATDAVDDTDGGEVQDGRRSYETCVGSYAWLYDKQGYDWTELAGRREKGPKTSVALIIGYLGHHFAGLQQPWIASENFVRAVETELELALLKAGAMIPENFGNLCRLRWSRVGRTDGGVSAACNVVTGRLIVGKEQGALDALVERIRSFLPPDVELHGAATVSKRYNARWEGARRDYRFLLPSFCVAPTLAKVRQWLAENRHMESPTGFNVEDLREIEEELGLRQVRLTDDQLQRFREAFCSFEGTHYFGNFANKKLDPMGPQGFRHLRRVACGEPFVDDFGREWLPLEISGDSFLTHQIRKMVATAALVAQGILSLEFIQAAMHRRIYVKTQRFPPVGLMFQRPFFSPKTPQRAGVEAALQSEAVSDRIAAMKARLEEAILKEADDRRSAVKWLACVAHFEPEDMESEVLKEFRELKSSMDRQIRGRRAASTQVVCIRAGEGSDLWLGRHFQSR